VIKIYDFPHGARGLRMAWLCEEMRLAHNFVPVGFPPDTNYRALNPFGTVPFLQDGNVSMSESVAMMLYIGQKYGPTDVLPMRDDERFAKILQFTLIGEASLSSLMTPLLAVRFGAPNDQKRNWSAVGIESRLKGTIDRIGDELGDREFLLGFSLTLADISVATALRIWDRGRKIARRRRYPPRCDRTCSRGVRFRGVHHHPPRARRRAQALPQPDRNALSHPLDQCGLPPSRRRGVRLHHGRHRSEGVLEQRALHCARGAVREYMVRLRAHAGVYLVGWFEADKWDPADGRRKTVPKMSVDDVRAKLEGQAAGLPEGIIVRPVVVECRTPA